jgi:hypothetical protein
MTAHFAISCCVALEGGELLIDDWEENFGELLEDSSTDVNIIEEAVSERIKRNYPLWNNHEEGHSWLVYAFGNVVEPSLIDEKYKVTFQYLNIQEME